MYAALWRALPGRWPMKLLQTCVLVTAVIAICFVWLFPAIAPHLPYNDNTVTNHTSVKQQHEGSGAGSVIAGSAG